MLQLDRRVVAKAGMDLGGLDHRARREFDVAVLDMMLPGMTGLDLLAKIKEGPTDCEVVMLTGQATVETAVAAMKAGAYDSLLFHRVVQGFMVQGGDPQSRRAGEGVILGGGGPDQTLPTEIVPGLIHKKGALAAARTWPYAELDTLTAFLRTAVLPHAIDAADRLYPNGVAAPFTQLRAEHAHIYALTELLEHADATPCTLSELRRLVDGLEHHMIEEQAVLAALPATLNDAPCMPDPDPGAQQQDPSPQERLLPSAHRRHHLAAVGLRR